MKQYLDLARHIMENKMVQENQIRLGTGTKVLFG